VNVKVFLSDEYCRRLELRSGSKVSFESFVSPSRIYSGGFITGALVIGDTIANDV
jgi:hypothetical protein